MPAPTCPGTDRYGPDPEDLGMADRARPMLWTMPIAASERAVSTAGPRQRPEGVRTVGAQAEHMALQAQRLDDPAVATWRT